MIGALILIVLMVTVFPVGLFLTGAVVSGLHGWWYTDQAEKTHAGSEMFEASKKLGRTTA